MHSRDASQLNHIIIINNLSRTAITVIAHLCCALSFSAASRAEESPTPDQAVDAYRQYLTSISNVSFKSAFKDRIAEKSDVYTNGLAQEWKVDFLGKRLWRTTRKFLRSVEPSAHYKKTYNEQLHTPNKMQEIGVDSNTGVVQSFTDYAEIPQNSWKTHSGFLYLSYPFGYLPGNQNNPCILELLRDVTVTSAEPQAITLSSATDEFRLSLRLDPSRGWMANRIEYKLIGDTKGGAHRIYCLYEVTKSSRFDGVWMPVVYHCREILAAHEVRNAKLRVVEGAVVSVNEDDQVGEPYIIKYPESTLDAVVALSEISTHSLSDADFQLQAKVPDGIRVSVQDDWATQYEWRAGRVVRCVDGVPLRK